MAPEKISRQYGLWDSPISPISLARGIVFTDVAWDHDGTLVWREGRSDRGMLVIQKPGGEAPRDLNSEFSIRARVGYGGGDFTVGDGQAYFVEADSGRFYRQSLSSGEPNPITPAFGHFSSPSLSPDGSWLAFVHSYEGQDSLGIVDAGGNSWPAKLVSGADFYMQPTWHPDNTRLAWIDWNHPNMPWDGCFLRMGTLSFPEKGLPLLEEITTLAGGHSTSVFQPQFSPNGHYMAFASDATGWWQLYLYDLSNGDQHQLTSAEADHGLPAWAQGLRTFAFSPDGSVIFYIRNQAGFASLWRLDIASGVHTQISLDDGYTWLDQIAIAPKLDDNDQILIALIASGGQTPPRLITRSFLLAGEIHTTTPASWHIRARSAAEEIPTPSYTLPKKIVWQGQEGSDIYGLYYPPHNPSFEGLGLPPLIVLIHGGPTSQRRAKFDPEAQFFATRGYAVLEVNYRGSTGYGRPYWEALKGNWGLYDVQDGVSGADHLSKIGEVDGSRIVIMGGSAGGYTVLQALENHPGYFKAGICLYGVANQFTLAAETHKFEEHYLDTLLGPLPEASSLYRERSPIFQADRIVDPIAIFHGEDDQVVPRTQSDEIVVSLKKRGISHEYHLYPGEGHGFRKTETIEDFYRRVEQFLKQYVIFA
jgi:dipeptidyl aminopeptidase/acylaminoacyl peptidase